MVVAPHIPFSVQLTVKCIRCGKPHIDHQFLSIGEMLEIITPMNELCRECTIKIENEDKE